MRDPVLGEVGARCKSLPAEIAVKRLVPGVDPLVAD